MEGSLALLSPLFELLCGMVVQCTVDGCLQEAPHNLPPIRFQDIFCLLLHARCTLFMSRWRWTRVLATNVHHSSLTHTHSCASRSALARHAIRGREKADLRLFAHDGKGGQLLCFLGEIVEGTCHISVEPLYLGWWSRLQCLQGIHITPGVLTSALRTYSTLMPSQMPGMQSLGCHGPTCTLMRLFRSRCACRSAVLAVEMLCDLQDIAQGIWHVYSFV